MCCSGSFRLRKLFLQSGLHFGFFGTVGRAVVFEVVGFGLVGRIFSRGRVFGVPMLIVGSDDRIRDG